MCCLIRGGNKEISNKFGLFSGHAYTLIGAYEANGIKLVKL